MTLNIENLDKLINHLKNLKNPSTFNMRDWLELDTNQLEELNINTSGKLKQRLVYEGDCGTVACIAGHARLLARPREKLEYHKDYADDTQVIAQNWLGLDQWQSEDLFIPSGVFLINASLKLAIRVLENLKKSALEGYPTVDWYEARNQIYEEERAQAT